MVRRRTEGGSIVTVDRRRCSDWTSDQTSSRIGGELFSELDNLLPHGRQENTETCPPFSWSPAEPMEPVAKVS